MAVIGIDLGTTFSSIAFLQNGKPVVINDEEGRKSIPSVVLINKYLLDIMHLSMSLSIQKMS